MKHLLDSSAKSFGDRPALAYVGETPLTYIQTQQRVNALIAYFEEKGLKSGDKIGILSDNSPEWAIAYFAIASMGAVTVPMLVGLSSKEIENILSHASVKMIMVSDNLKYKIDKIENTDILNNLMLVDIAILESDAFDLDATPQKEYNIKEDDLAALLYTSGTTGRSKGVMLTHKNIVWNAHSCRTIQDVNSEDRFLSILPLAHTYENTLGLLFPFTGGASISYSRSALSPSVMMKALAEVKPTIFLSVPLIIEKIFKAKILPAFNKNKVISTLYRVKPVKKLLHKAAGKKLKESFGGELKFFGIGGSKLDAVVEQFLLDANFPVAIGYGLTETAPMLAGTSPSIACLQSAGLAMKGVDLKINEPDPVTGIGEIWAKGPNIMKGYYKEPDLTAEVLTPDGWFKTGDLAMIGENNHLYIRGRNKNMILGSSGENIYPEDIESLINSFSYVQESLVVQKDGKLVAFVHFNIDELEKKYHHLKDKLQDFVSNKQEELIKELQIYINQNVSKGAKLSAVIIEQNPFEKTATHKIKRYIY